MNLKKSTLPRHMRPKEESDEGRAAWRIAAFFLLMLALTLFARGMAGAAQTTVLTQTPTAATVTEALTLPGMGEPERRSAHPSGWADGAIRSGDGGADGEGGGIPAPAGYGHH